MGRADGAAPAEAAPFGEGETIAGAVCRCAGWTALIAGAGADEADEIGLTEGAMEWSGMTAPRGGGLSRWWSSSPWFIIIPCP